MPKRRIDGHLVRQCNGRHTNNSSVRKLKNNIGVGKRNENPGMAFLHHLTCTCQLTSDAVSQTDSPSNFNLGFQSSPLCHYALDIEGDLPLPSSQSGLPHVLPPARGAMTDHTDERQLNIIYADKYASLHVGKKTVVNLHTPADYNVPQTSHLQSELRVQELEQFILIPDEVYAVLPHFDPPFRILT